MTKTSIKLFKTICPQEETINKKWSVNRKKIGIILSKKVLQLAFYDLQKAFLI